MKYFKTLESIKTKKKLIILLGNFDGLHLGHKKLLNIAIKENINNKYFVLLLTFNPNSKIIKDNSIKYLTILEEKKYLIKKYKINGILTLSFNYEFSHLTKKEFLKNILFKNLNIKTIIVGHDFHFGYKAKGDVLYLKKKCIEYNCMIKEVKPYKINKEIISSTIIRKLLLKGNIIKANKLLGYNYTFIGKIIHGENRGKTLGFPTANIKFNKNKLIPKEGVYGIKSKFKNNIIFGMCNIGYQPTFKKNKHLKIEINLFDFDQNIYGKKFIFELIFFVRKEMKFKNKLKLIKQLEKDKKNILKRIKDC